jgi:hypothetical protein
MFIRDRQAPVIGFSGSGIGNGSSNGQYNQILRAADKLER